MLFLELFRHMLLHTEILFSIFQACILTMVILSNAVSNCVNAVQSLRTEVDGIDQEHLTMVLITTIAVEYLPRKLMVLSAISCRKFF